MCAWIAALSTFASADEPSTVSLASRRTSKRYVASIESTSGMRLRSPPVAREAASTRDAVDWQLKSWSVQRRRSLAPCSLSQTRLCSPRKHREGLRECVALVRAPCSTSATSHLRHDYRLQENDKNLKSKWTALQAAEKLRELDNRLTKSFTSKISLGVFSALQDSRAQTAALSSSLDHLHSSLENIVERASSQSLQKAIALLQEDADMARGRDGHKGFANGEPEKLISALVDKLSAQADLLAEAGEPPRGTNHFWSDSELVRSPHAASTRYASTDASSLLSRRPAQRHTSTTTVRTNGSSRNSDLISFAIRDPLTQQILVDPVLGSDGKCLFRAYTQRLNLRSGVIHDRWTLVHEAHPNPHCPTDVRRWWRP